MNRQRRAKPIPAPPTPETQRRSVLMPPAALVLIGLVVCASYLAYRRHSLRASGRPQYIAAEGPKLGSPTGGFQPTLENRDSPPETPPIGMVWIPGGEFSMGTNGPPDMDDVGMKATFDARPTHRVYVDGFYMDKTDVTNAQFAEFVRATGYLTMAERTPRPEDFPTLAPKDLVPGGVVFTPPKHKVALDKYLEWWSFVKGANWRHPNGPKSDIRAKRIIRLSR